MLFILLKSCCKGIIFGLSSNVSTGLATRLAEMLNIVAEVKSDLHF